MKHLDPRVITLWRMQGLVQVVTFWLPVFSVLGVVAGLKLGVVVGLSIAVAGSLGMLTLALVWPALRHRRFRFALHEHELLVEQGVLFRLAVSVPLNRIQHVDTRQGPLERLNGLMRLQVYTAAGYAADASIPGLDETEAHRLRDLLARRGGDDGV